MYTLIYVLQQIDWTFCTYLPFSAEAKQLAFFSERCTFEAVCFFTVVETLLGRIFFLCEEGTINLVELLAFFVESTAPWLIPIQDWDATPMKHGCVSGLGCGCGTRQFLKK